MIRNGQFVGAHLTPTQDSSIEFENIQPNGVDLRARQIEEIVGDTAVFGTDGYSKPERETVEMFNRHFDSRRESTWRLTPGRYAVIYDETIRIPEGHVGRVYPRSRVMRSGLHLTSALWDQGYEGRGEGMLQVPDELDHVDIQVGASLAQMVFEKADGVDEAYDGSHQGERLNE